MTDAELRAAHQTLLDTHRSAPGDETRAALVAAMTVETERARELRAAGQPAAARRALEGALTLGRAAHPGGAACLVAPYGALGEVLEALEDREGAEAAYRAALAADDPAAEPPRRGLRGRIRARLAVMLHRADRLDEAEALYRAALEVLGAVSSAPPEEAMPDRAPRAAQTAVATVANSFAALLWQVGRRREALEQAERALAILDAVHPPDHEALVAQQLDVAHMRERSGRAVEAIELYEGVLARRGARIGQGDPALAPVWLGLAHARSRADRLDEALEAYEEAWSGIGGRTADAQPDPLRTGTLLGLAYALARARRVDEAVARLNDELARLGSSLGADHPSTTAMVDHIADLLEEAGRYEQALAWVGSQSGQRAPRMRDALTRGRLLARLGRLEEAEAAFRRALEIGAPESGVGIAHTGLATVLSGLGRSAEAERSARRALAIADASGDDASEELNNLALVMRQTGRLDEAEQLYRRALAGFVQTRGAEHPLTGLVLNNLAMTLTAAGRLEEAESLSGHALALAEHSHGPTHPLTLARRSNRAVVLRQLGRLEEATALFREAERALLEIRPAHHPDVGTVTSNLGEVLAANGEHAEAERCFVRAIQAHATSFGHEHPAVGRDWLNLARLRVRRRRLDEAHVALDRALAIEEHDLRHNLLYGTPADRRARLRQTSSSTADAITLHLRWRPDAVSSARLALRTVLRRKGRAVDIEQDTLAAARRSEPGSPPERALTALRDLQAELSRLTHHPPTGRDGFERWRSARSSVLERIAERQRALSEAVPAISEALASVTVSGVTEALGPRRGLLELVVYEPHDFDAGRFGPPRVAAYLLVPGEPDASITARDLGPRRALDTVVDALRTAIQERRDPTPRARTLFRQLFEPFGGALRGLERLVVATDGPVGLVPLELVLEAGGWDLELHLVTSGRDLLRQVPDESPGRPVVVYDVDFGGDGPWSPLPGAREEGRIVAERLGDPRTLTGGAATETAVKRLCGPRVLHVATHGYVEPPAVVDDHPEVGPRLRGAGRGAVRPEPPPPSLRSGIVLAGANLPPRGDDDGRLTAAEVASLDLRGTALAVFSACETGVAVPELGEGIAGLRRALVVAGARAQLLSLWPVDDAGTAALMTALYERLAAGWPIGRALAEAKAELRAHPSYSDPYVWAAFSLSGDPTVRLGA